MKKHLTLPLLLLCGMASSGQVLKLDVGHNLDDMRQLSVTAGFLSPINGSTFTAGIVYKQYTKANRTGLRLDVQIPIGKWAHFYTLSDAYFDQPDNYDGTFLEIGAGVGVNWKGVSLNAGYQMNDFNKETDTDREDKFLCRIGYRIKLWQ